MLTTSSVSASSALSEATIPSLSATSLSEAVHSSVSATSLSSHLKQVSAIKDLPPINMGGKGNKSQNGQPLNRHRANSTHSVSSGLSTKLGNSAYFNINSPVSSSILVQSQTWKSEEAKQREKFDRSRNLLQYFTPEQFKNRAKPSDGPANIVPQTFLQYQIHEKEMEAEKMLNKIAMLEAKKNRKGLLPIRPAFESKVFESDRSSVLSQSTIWSDNFKSTYEHPQIAWPDRDQLHEDGEKRENRFAPTRCGRFLPALRYPDTGVFMVQYPLDQVGPLRSQGPTPAECKVTNEEMDFDDAFEAHGVELLGYELMGELGHQLPPFVPDWLAQQRYGKEMVSGQCYQYQRGLLIY
jgi:hypothetical protein